MKQYCDDGFHYPISDILLYLPFTVFQIFALLFLTKNVLVLSDLFFRASVVYYLKIHI